MKFQCLEKNLSCKIKKIWKWLKQSNNNVVEWAEVVNTLHAGESSIHTKKLSRKIPQI